MRGEGKGIKGGGAAKGTIAVGGVEKRDFSRLGLDTNAVWVDARQMMTTRTVPKERKKEGCGALAVARASPVPIFVKQEFFFGNKKTQVGIPAGFRLLAR